MKYLTKDGVLGAIGLWAVTFYIYLLLCIYREVNLKVEPIESRVQTNYTIFMDGWREGSGKEPPDDLYKTYVKIMSRRVGR